MTDVRVEYHIPNHSEAYRAYCMLRADLDAGVAWRQGPGTSGYASEDVMLDAMAGLLEMMLPAERALLNNEGPMVLP